MVVKYEAVMLFLRNESRQGGNDMEDETNSKVFLTKSKQKHLEHNQKKITQ